MSKTISITFGNNVRKQYEIDTIEFEDFADLTGTLEDFIADCDAEAKLDLPYLCAGTFEYPRRAKANLSGAEVLILDIDSDWSIEDASAYLSKKRWAFFIYTSWSHTADTDRFRIIIPLDRKCSPNEYTALCKTLVADGVKGLDATKFGAESAMFLTTTQRVVRTLSGGGVPISVDATIALHGVSVEPKRVYQKPTFESSKIIEWKRQRDGLKTLFDVPTSEWWSNEDVAWWYGKDRWHSSMPALAVKLHHSIRQRCGVKTTGSEVQEVLVAFLNAHSNAEFQQANCNDLQINDAMRVASLQGGF